MKFVDSIYRKVLLPEIDEITDPLKELGPHFEWAKKEIQSVPEKISHFKYLEGKWTTAQILGHLVDTQLIWLFRILWIARGETRPLEYADENLWTEKSNYDGRSIKEIAEKYIVVCRSTETIIHSLPSQALEFQGNVNGVEFNTRQAIQTLIAHEKHHLRVIREKYIQSYNGKNAA